MTAPRAALMLRTYGLQEDTVNSGSTTVSNVRKVSSLYFYWEEMSSVVEISLTHLTHSSHSSHSLISLTRLTHL